MSENETRQVRSRREFLKHVAVGTGAVTLAGVSLGEAKAPKAKVPQKWDYEADVVVAGAGNGGLSAAIAAAEEGAKTIAVEISAKVGGGSAFSEGWIHMQGIETWEEYQERTEGMHDPVLAKVYFETFRHVYIPWLHKIGAYFQRDGSGPLYMKDYVMGKGEPGTLRNRKYFDSLEEIFKKHKGTLLLPKTRVQKLIIGDDGRVIGLNASSWQASPLEGRNQKTVRIKANKAVILATGNFHANPAMMQEHLGPHADRARPMGVPYSTGEGILMAREVGAMMSGSLSSWSGVFCAATPRKPINSDPDEYEMVLAKTPAEDLGQVLMAGRRYVLWTASGILINLDGKRFIDEGLDRRHVLQASQYERDARIFAIADSKVIRSPELIFKPIIEEGGTVIQADKLEDLASKLQKIGVSKGNFLRTIEEYNQALEKHNGWQLDPPRSQESLKLGTPPFYAVELTVAVYFNMGGLAINKNAQVLDMQHRPIAGLYAVPPAGGGIQNITYAGGTGCAGSFGYIAGKHAVKRSFR